MRFGKKKPLPSVRPQISQVVRPVAAPPVAMKPAVKPVAKAAVAAPKVAPVVIKTDGLVNIHMLGNAMLGDVQYIAGQDYRVTPSTMRSIGTSCITQTDWLARAKGLKTLPR